MIPVGFQVPTGFIPYSRRFLRNRQYLIRPTGIIADLVVVAANAN